MRGYYIVLEGLEGSGKTTLINFIFKVLLKIGIKSILKIREPGSTPFSEIIRKILKGKGIYSNLEKIQDKTELLLFYAARAQLVDTIIKPALSNGKWVIGDRHDLSTKAYQSGGRKINLKLINFLQNIILGSFKPDLTFYLDVDPIIGLNRKLKNSNKLDRIERESLDFFNRTRKKYLELALKDKKVFIINANCSFKNVKYSILMHLKNWLKIIN